MLKNCDIELLIKIENLIGMNEKLLFTDDKTVNEKSSVTYDDFIDFWNLIEREIEKKKEANKKSNEYNKKHPEKHNQQNKEYYRRKKEKLKKESENQTVKGL